MARRFRYSFARKQEAGKGRLSLILCFVSLALFFIAVMFSGRITGRFAFVPGTIGLFAAMLNVYGFGLGLSGFSEAGKKHRTCIAGSIINGILLVGWIGLYQLGR